MSYSERPRLVRIPQLPSRGQTVDLQWTGPTLDEAASGGADLQFSSEEARERLQPRTVYSASAVPSL